MTRISNFQCQICHTAAFGSFSNGHPDIAERYAFDQPKGLNFDHTSHLEVLFSLAGDDEIHCGSCHVPDEFGRHMILNNFETMCSECHEDQIFTDEDEDGLVVFNLPAFAPYLTRDQRESIGAWPEKVGAEMSPYFRLLLLGDDAYPQGHEPSNDLERWSSINKIGRSGDKLKASETEVVGRLAWAIRRFVDQLGDRESVRKRVEHAVGFAISSGESEVLLEALSVSVGFRSGVEHWLSAPPVAVHQEDYQSEFEETWSREDATYSVVYRPTNHADPLLRTWLDLVSRLIHNREEGDPRRKIAVEILSTLKEDESPGSCLKCHIADHVDSAGRMIWKPRSPSEPGRMSAVFMHYPHFGLVDCTGCHTQRHEERTSTSSGMAHEGRDSRFAGDFASMGKRNCSSCHVPELAGDSCLQCHYYHFGKMVQRVRKTSSSSQEPHGD